MRDEIAEGHVPGAVVLVGRRGRIVYRAAFGAAAILPGRRPMRTDAIFDLASLTKVVATTTAIMQLAETGSIRLDAPVASYWPAFAARGKAAITVRQLLTHMSGLRPDLEPSGAWSGETGALALIAAERPVVPPGSQFLYSDLNFIVLGALVEKVSGERLDRYVRRHILSPLGMRDSGFRTSATQRRRIIPTDIERATLRWGEVQDPTAYRMGGIAGHAGLFSTADDLARFAEMLLQGGSLDGRRILRPKTVSQMVTPAHLPSGIRRGLGWDIASPYAAAFGGAFGPHSFGHTGYTGTALWIDPDTGSFVIILASRLHPDGHGQVKALRSRIAHVVAHLAAPMMPPSPAVGSANRQLQMIRYRHGRQLCRGHVQERAAAR